VVFYTKNIRGIIIYMKKILTIFAIIFAIIIIILGFLFVVKKTTPPEIVVCTADVKLCPDGSAVGRVAPACEFAPCPATKNISDLIRVSTPIEDAVVMSPLIIEGEARGTWYFEASFPIRIYDAKNQLLGTAIAQAQSDWMTENFVPFKTTLTFSKSTTPTGTLVLEKDNPSGLPEHANELRIPIRFELADKSQRTISLYYYDASKDKDASGNIMCSRRGLVPVARTIPLTLTPVQDAVKLLLKGSITNEEKQKGITTEFPLSGVVLTGAAKKGDVVTLSFLDPNSKTSGGSCRAGILWFQIEATAKQFPGITSVKFIPEDIFQP